jgi:membrane-bound lytic murein transglycosylase B
VAFGTENRAGAGGPMQFLAGTWARWGRGGDRWNYRHAIPAAARKLCADGVAGGDVRAALWAYNHSNRCVARVLAEARRYQAGGGGR